MMMMMMMMMRKEREKVSISDFEIELKLHINNLYAAAASGSIHDFNKGALSIRKICFSPKNEAFRWVKYSPIFESNLAPLIRANTVQLPTADLHPGAEMGPIVGWNRLLMGLLWLKLCANGSKRGWIRLRPAGLNWHFGAETDLLNFQCWRAINLCLI